MRKRIDNILEEITFAKALLADGFEEALIGHTQGPNVVAVYEYGMCIHILMERDGMDVMEAVEYMDFNVLGAYAGEKTPIFVSLA